MNAKMKEKKIIIFFVMVDQKKDIYPDNHILLSMKTHVQENSDYLGRYLFVVNISKEIIFYHDVVQ